MTVEGEVYTGPVTTSPSLKYLTRVPLIQQAKKVFTDYKTTNLAVLQNVYRYYYNITCIVCTCTLYIHTYIHIYIYTYIIYIYIVTACFFRSPGLPLVETSTLSTDVHNLLSENGFIGTVADVQFNVSTMTCTTYNVIFFYRSAVLSL